MSDDATTETTTTATETETVRHASRADSTCSVEGCKRPYRAKGYCNVHYKAWRHGEVEGHKGRYKICTKEACRKPRAFGSLCAEHGKKEAPAAA